MISAIFAVSMKKLVENCPIKAFRLVNHSHLFMLHLLFLDDKVNKRDPFFPKKKPNTFDRGFGQDLAGIGNEKDRIGVAKVANGAVDVCAP